MGAQISPVVRPDRNQALPVLLRCTRIGLSFAFRKSRSGSRTSYWTLISFNALSTHFSSRPATIATTSPTNRTWRSISSDHTGSAPVGLTCLSISSSVLWDILPCIDCLDAVHLHCGSLVYGCHHRICVRRSQKLHDQAVLRCDIIHIDRLSRYELHRVLFPYRLIYIFHDFSDSFPLFSFFHARNAWIPRSCPS